MIKLQNLPLAILSLLISLGLWLYVRTTTTGDQASIEPGVFPIDVDLLNAAPDFILPPKPRIVLTATGTAEEVSRVTNEIAGNPAQLEVWVDLSNAKFGENRYPIQVNPPKGYDVKWQYPKDIKITLDLRDRSKTVPVTVLTTGVPPDGYISERQDTDPKTVTVEGSQLKLDEVKKAVVTLDLSQFREGEAMRGTVHLQNENGETLVSGLTVRPEQVIILAALKPKGSAAKFLVNPVIEGQPAPGYRVDRIDVLPNQVVIRGPSEVLARTITVDTKPIDISGLRANHTFSVTLQLPDPLKAASAVPVQVSISIVPQAVAPPSPTPTPSIPP